MKFLAIIFFLFLFIILSNNVLAQTDSTVGSGSGSVLTDPLNGSTLTDIFQNIISFFIKIGAPITAIMVLYGGYLILTAGDKSEQISKGKMAILYAAVGYIVVLSAWGVIAIIKEVLNSS